MAATSTSTTATRLSSPVAAAALAAGALSWLMHFAYYALGGDARALEIALVAGSFGGAFVACLAAAWGRSDGRGPWLLLALALGAYSQTSIAYSVVPEVAARFPSLHDAGLFAFYPLLFASFITFVRRHVAGFSKGLWIDALIGALVAAALGAAAVDPHLKGLRDAELNQQLPFFLADLGFLGFLLVACAVSGWRYGSRLVLLAGGTALLAVGDGMWAIEVGDGASTPGTVVAAAWPAGILLLAAGAWRASEGVPLWNSPWAKVGVPAGAALACLPLMFLAPDGSLARPLASIAVCLIVVRLTMSLVENDRLLGSAQDAAITDPLTGLANRQLLIERLQAALARRRGIVGVLFFDLDDFKAINDSHGHDVGDRVLIAVAERVECVLRREDALAGDPPSGRRRDTVGRLGGDEFVVLLEGLRDPRDATAIAERILDAVRAPLVVAHQPAALDASIGVTVADGASERGAFEILRDADTAMYVAKQGGKGRYRVFEPAMHEAVVARSELTRDLRLAVSEGQLALLYQPQVDVASGHMIGVEALVRWRHPRRGLLAPDEFIPTAEATGLITPIDDWVLHEACRQLRAWDDAGVRPLHMAVNVSARRLGADGLPEAVRAAIRDAGIAPVRLEIELTETVAVEHDGHAAAAIAAVRELGVRAAIDDFGKGHSALSRLQSFPVDRIKIDRTFIAPLGDGNERGSIADAMIALGLSLGLGVVAEGVETEAQLEALRSLGCASAQGYLFSKPVPAEAIAQLARTGAPLGPGGASGTSDRERLVRTVLAELQRLTGLETTYLTRIDRQKAEQRITHARNTGALDIPEGLRVDWADAVCRRALERGLNYTDDVGATFPDSDAARDLGLQTYVSVPLINGDGDTEGTLCGGSTLRVPLGPETVQVMERFARMIAA
jgi:predicted signal transduction protein with EAL and GGDEF domain